MTLPKDYGVAKGWPIGSGSFQQNLALPDGSVTPPVSQIITTQILGVYGEIGFTGGTFNSGSEVLPQLFPIDAYIPTTMIGVVSSSGWISSASVPTASGQDTYRRAQLRDSAGTSLAADAALTTIPAGQNVLHSQFTGSFPAARYLLQYEASVPAGGGTIGLTVGLETAATSSAVKKGTALAAGNSNIGGSAPTGAVGGGNVVAPRAVVGTGQHGYTFNCIGDSIAFTNSEGTFGDGGPVGNEGRTVQAGAWVRRSFDGASRNKGVRVPLAMTVRASAFLYNNGSGAGLQSAPTLHRALYPYASVLVVQIGTNDLNAGQTAVQLKATVEAEITAYKSAFNSGLNAGKGVTPRAIVCTLLPRQSTPTGTTSKPEFISYNAYVRSGQIAGSDGYLDPNKGVSNFGVNGSDESIWADGTNDSADGTHPTATGHAKIASYVSPTLSATQPWLSFAGVTPISISGTPGNATVGTAYNFTPTTANGSGTKTFSMSGTLPSGLSFSTTTGSISGTPTASGTFSGISITVTDSSGSATLSNLSITVAASGGAYTPAASPGLIEFYDSRQGVTNSGGTATAWAATAGGANNITLANAPAYSGNLLTFAKGSLQYGTLASLIDRATTVGSFDITMLIKFTSVSTNLLGWSGGTSTFITTQGTSPNVAALIAKTVGASTNGQPPFPSNLATATWAVLRYTYDVTSNNITVYLNGVAGTATAAGGTGGFKFDQIGKAGGTYGDYKLGPIRIGGTILTGTDATNDQNYFEALRSQAAANGSIT